MDTTGCGITAVISTRIAIIAAYGRIFTLPLIIASVRCAGIPIIATGVITIFFNATSAGAAVSVRRVSVITLLSVLFLQNSISTKDFAAAGVKTAGFSGSVNTQLSVAQETTFRTGGTAIWNFFMDTASRRIAAIFGTVIAVIAVYVRHPLAGSVFTRVSRCTGIIIIARGCIVHIFTAGRRIASVVSTRIAIITVYGCPSSASSIRALFSRRAGIFIIARICVVRVDTPCCRVTTVIGANIIIIAA